MGEAIARHFDIDLPLILKEGLRWITSNNAEAAEAGGREWVRSGW
jgi:hypothetical protein